VKLGELIAAIDAENRVLRNPAGDRGSAPGPDIASVHYRSQEVTPGGLFVAIAGRKADGHDFIEDAFRRGAAAALTQRPAGRGGMTIQVADTRRALADVAARFYRQPSERLTVIGITGTNGKTTTAYLVESVLAEAGFSVGVIGTINYRYAGVSHANPVTTPESLDLQRILAEMATAGVTHAVMEVSSHAIAQGRIRNCWLDAAVFTNISQDHLDFHGDMQTYWDCKQRLFTEHLTDGPKADRATAVINCSQPEGAALAAGLTCRKIRLGGDRSSQIHAESAACDLTGIRARVVTPRGEIAVRSRLVGKHNVENILCAVGAAEALGLPKEAVSAGIDRMPQVPGRLEAIENDTGRFVYVDYAHTPDALENVLAAIGQLAGGRVITVFGCGGDRDRGKRPLMGAIAARHSDLAIVTSDNPRTEDPMGIIAEIESGIRPLGLPALSAAALANGNQSGGYAIEPDRRRAIALAIGTARPGDTVLIAGKGHETYQIVGTTTISFDDRQEALRALAAVTEAD